MTTRSDLFVDWEESPRVVEVEAPSDEFVMQDVVDSLRKQEDTFRGISEPRLLDASGKEDLGGGTLVGITVALQNTLLAFEGRTTPAQTGTVTTGSGTPFGQIMRYSFEDTGATFQTNGVTRGSLIINFTDQSIAEVYRVESETLLFTKVLVNGTSNIWQVGDEYQIYNIEQVRATGGNLVAVDAGGTPLESGVLPTWGTQVLVTASSSATLQEQLDIQFASFNGGVTIDQGNITGNAAAGTQYPAGTIRQPCLTMTDLLAIQAERGLSKVYVIGDFTAPVGPDMSNLIFCGESKARTTITLPSAATMDNCEYLSSTVTGTLDGESSIIGCNVSGLDFVSGFVESCVLQPGTITLAGSGTAHFLDCWSGVPGMSTPIIDMNGSGMALAMRNYNGGIQINNKTGTDAVSIDLNSGQCVIDSTVTDGQVTIRGVGKLTDNSTGTADVVNELVSGVFIRTKLLTVKKFLGLK